MAGPTGPLGTLVFDAIGKALPEGSAAARPDTPGPACSTASSSARAPPTCWESPPRPTARTAAITPLDVRVAKDGVRLYARKGYYAPEAGAEGALADAALEASAPSSFWASTANSIGSSLNTSLQKPFTIMPTASSAPIPRERK